MGLIKAALGSAGGVLADTWKDYFVCDALANEVLMVKGTKRALVCSIRAMLLLTVLASL